MSLVEKKNRNSAKSYSFSILVVVGGLGGVGAAFFLEFYVISTLKPKVFERMLSPVARQLTKA